MSDSMREQLEAAFAENNDEEQEEQAGGSPEDAAESLGATPEGDAAGEELGGEEGGEGELGGEEEGGSPAGDVLPVSANVAGDAELPGEPQGAPVSWKPAIREHWAGLPPEVQGEIARREADHNKTLNDSAGFRKVADEYYRTVAPFQSLIQAQGSTPSQAIHNLMSTAAQLTQGTPQRKAQVIQNIINEYGVDITMLDTLLADMPLADDPNAPLLAAIDERLAPVQQFMGGVQQRNEQSHQATNNEAVEELGTFAASHSEFYEDLREDMADLLEMAANRNRPMSMEQAYERASAAHPEIGPILQQRANAAAGKLDPAAAARKRRAASSIRGSAAAGGGAPGQAAAEADNPRALMEELWDESSGGVEH